jgi:hypothetical protein
MWAKTHVNLFAHLVARFKQINTLKLYLPGKGKSFSYPGCARH